MIKYGPVTTADYKTIQFQIYGDGVTQVLKVNLNKPPFNVNFQDNPPIDMVATTGQDIDDEDLNTVEAEAHLDQAGNTMMTLTFAIAPPVPPGPTDVTYGMTITFRYPGL